MEYIDIDGDNFIEYDLETRQSRLLSKSKIEEELLKWAREVLESSVVVLEGKLSELTEKASPVTISSVTLKDRE